MYRFSLGQLLQATRGRCEGSASGVMPLRRIVCDSRQVQVGDVFWALPGQRSEGMQFVSDAFRRGAWGCVVHNPSQYPAAGVALEQASSDGPRFLLWVEDALLALERLAGWYRGRMSARVVGVTGSVGKTTTRELLHAALARRYTGKRSPKNYNNHIGVPLTLLALQRSDQYAVVELGANAPGEIAALATLCRPQIGIVTRIAEAHLEGFGSLEGVARAKAELLDALPPDGVAIVGGDDPWVRRIAQRAPCRVVYVGMQENNDWRARNVSSLPGRLRFELVLPDLREPLRPVEVAINGRHHVVGVLCALAGAYELGVPMEDAIAGLDDFRAPPQRGEVHHIGPVTVIDDSYNASPTSMAAALEMLAEWPGAARRIFAAGDMCELGDQSTQLHRDLGRAAAEQTDRVFVCGRYRDEVAEAAVAAGMAPEDVVAAPDADSLARALLEHSRPGDVVLVKGSRASQMDRVVQVLTQMEIPSEKAATVPARHAHRPVLA